MTEKAKEIVTARGRPSGIAITMTVTAVITAKLKSVKVAPSHGLALGARVLSKTHLPTPRRRAKRKNLKPILASWLAIPSSFCCRGV
jgi:hypothetical protein